MPTFFAPNTLLVTEAMVPRAIYPPNAATQAPAPASAVPRQPEFPCTQSRQQGSSQSRSAARLLQAMSERVCGGHGHLGKSK